MGWLSEFIDEDDHAKKHDAEEDDHAKKHDAEKGLEWLKKSVDRVKIRATKSQPYPTTTFAVFRLTLIIIRAMIFLIARCGLPDNPLHK